MTTSTSRIEKERRDLWVCANQYCMACGSHAPDYKKEGEWVTGCHRCRWQSDISLAIHHHRPVSEFLAKALLGETLEERGYRGMKENEIRAAILNLSFMHSLSVHCNWVTDDTGLLLRAVTNYIVPGAEQSQMFYGGISRVAEGAYKNPRVIWSDIAGTGYGFEFVVEHHPHASDIVTSPYLSTLRFADNYAPQTTPVLCFVPIRTYG